MQTAAEPAPRPVARVSWRPSPYFVVAALAVAFAVALSVRQPWGADFGLHAAVVGRLRDNLVHPGNPMVEATGTNPYFTPYPLVLALIARVTGLSGAVVLSAAAPVNLALLLWGLRRFVGLFTASRWAPLLALAFVPLLWGPAAPRWSGFPSLTGLPLILPYPSTVALALTLLAWTLLPGAIDTGSRGRWAGAGALGGLIVLIHPFTAVCAAIGALALATGRLRRGLDLRGPLIGVGVLAVLVLAWPYFRVTDLVAAAGELNAIHEALFADPVRRYGLAFLVGLPALYLRVRRDRRDPLVLLFAFSGVPVLTGWLTGSYALGRIWPLVLLALQVAAAVELARLLSPPRPLGLAWAALALGACIGGLTMQYGNLLLALPPDQLTTARRQAHDVTSSTDWSWVADATGRGAVVATDNTGAGRALLADEVRFVAPPWPDPLLPDEDQRRADLAEMLAADTPAPRRLELLRRYDVTWVLDTRGSFTWADPLSTEVVDGRGTARLLRVA